MRLVWFAIEMFSGAIIILLTIYALLTGEWRSFLFIVGSAILGVLMIEWFGHLIPGVNYLLRKWDKHDDGGR